MAREIHGAARSIKQGISLQPNSTMLADSMCTGDVPDGLCHALQSI